MSLKLYSKKCKKKNSGKSRFIENKIYQSIEIFDERKERVRIYSSNYKF